ncbi:glycosyltransferase [Mucilaginibacter aquaedulcis]|uniref:glycosyltransferase n=1 Tax=Mucilaginibacter aquaedulcis TaxID=1187081 RepID=UPI0025B4E97F|nr:glycosyltransferase [Mucilaginibacter aquaedulcis]MDN3548737.1 glycosyltransferase [Mucilaginibacter aquaedulcis]
MKFSVIIPTYNPHQDILSRTLVGLKRQTMKLDLWELIIINNNSSNNFQQNLNLDWHPSARLVNENKKGLTYARLKGFRESNAEFILMVDDDNVLKSDYLEQAYDIFNRYPYIGAIGGKSVPSFEISPPDWLSEFYSILALRDFGDEALTTSWDHTYPDTAPIGAGMAIRRTALNSYIKKISLGTNTISDRTPTSLTSGGDNDIILEIMKSGWQIGYFPQLVLKHIIPAERLTPTYLARLANDSSKSWAKLLQSHRINPWKTIKKSGILPRKIKAWFTYKAWKNHASYIRWRGACGLFEGLAEEIHS